MAGWHSTLLAIALLGGCSQTGRIVRKTEDDWTPGGKVFSIDRRVEVRGGVAVLYATFHNLSNVPLTLIVRKMDVNLFEPLSGLPARLEIPPEGRQTLSLDYPQAAATPKTEAEKMWVVPMEGVDRDAPSLNYKVDYPNQTFSGSSELNEIAEPSPAVVTHPGSRALAFFNDRSVRGMDVRVTGVLIGGRQMLKSPVDLRLPAGKPMPVPGVLLPKGKPDSRYAYSVVVKYAYRLVPNRKWRLESMPLG